MQNVFDVPLKEGISLPCLKFDIALYCQTLNSVLPITPPDYLKDYVSQVRNMASNTQVYRPDTFPDCTRTYIFDSRMRTLFATLDQSKVTTAVMYTYAQEAFRPSDYFFGNGYCPSGIIDEGSSLEKFVEDFQFIPNDFFAFNHIAFFYQDNFISSAHLSAFQMAILLDHYKEQNFVDFRKIAEREVQPYREKLPL